MKTIKSKAKQYELALQGLLLYIEDGGYRKANIGMVIAQHGKMTFYTKN